ncbi:MAG: homocysteine S-methyltransferase family protein [Candidatus Nanopelagicales bacterium]|jgi:5-methyltetrahydrofolate--homocysteine methyltransferase|nr:homocysteine S-methyltransferase family protein [Candidatus Nanopelagicales bacterium]MDP4666939.1 homocysteine S-methyltransferase family protein [Candidatus Nanopelagicales bacterium]MDP4895915.1 homocysteine S-methyltransferase family protein [Candidatus Nanopelagicales bacterium]MDP5050613.1 homocysteine S-methyltransferase family protein [Candidatus Nanopelagicales bacterium]
MANVYEWLDAGNPLVGDGAMGTALQDLGLTDGGAPELWNVEQPEKVASVLRGYAAAGSNVVTTNTFGGTKGRLEMHDLGDRVHELNKAGSEVARSVADQFENVFVFGDVGPSGELMDPMGTLTPESGKALFAEQIRGLVDGGCDAILIETMSDLGEVAAAVEAAKEVAPGMPIVATLSFDTNLRTMMGVKPAQAITAIADMGVRLIGANCGRGTDEMRIIASELADAKPAGVHIFIQSNAGLPQLVGADFVYTGTPEEMGEFATEMKDLGIKAIGSCCGSTNVHTAAIAQALNS